MDDSKPNMISVSLHLMTGSTCGSYDIAHRLLRYNLLQQISTLCFFTFVSTRCVALASSTIAQGKNATHNDDVGGTEDSAVATGSRRLATRFQAMVGWEQSNHPVVVFKAGGAVNPLEVSGIDILSMNRHQRCVTTKHFNRTI